MLRKKILKIYIVSAGVLVVVYSILTFIGVTSEAMRYQIFESLFILFSIDVSLFLIVSEIGVFDGKEKRKS